MGAARRGPLSLPTPPKGWPVGSYPTYAEAQKAVDHLSDNQFPVQQVTIVGVDLMQVERVIGRLSWGKVLLGGVLSGAWLGVFIGLGLNSPDGLAAAAGLTRKLARRCWFLLDCGLDPGINPGVFGKLLDFLPDF
jgi:hypothetical protein